MLIICWFFSISRDVYYDHISTLSVPEVNLLGMSGFYFFRGFEYKEIILLLLKNHGIEMSLRTLKRRIKSYGLRRQQLEYNIDQVRASVPTIIDGHGSLQGYRSVWHTLQLRGTR